MQVGLEQGKSQRSDAGGDTLYYQGSAFCKAFERQLIALRKKKKKRRLILY